MKRLLYRGRKFCAKPASEDGFTLIEVLVAMTILTVLVGISVSSLSGNLPKWRLRGATDEIVTVFQKARALSVKKNKWVIVQFSGVNTPATCAVRIYLDKNDNGVVDAADTRMHNMLLASRFKAAYVRSVTNGAATATTSIMLSPDGTIKPSTLTMPISIVMASTSAQAPRTFTVVVERSGLARVK